MQLGVDHRSSRIIDTYVAASVKVVDSKVASATAVMVDSSVTVMVVPINVVDAAAELDRLKKEIAKVEAELATVKKKLSNANFVQNAPPAVVEEHRNREADWSEKLSHLQKMMQSLGT